MILISLDEAVETLERLHKNKQTIDAIKGCKMYNWSQGRWILEPGETICSNCKMGFSTEIHYLNFEMGEANYCPNCGADMREE